MAKPRPRYLARTAVLEPAANPFPGCGAACGAGLVPPAGAAQPSGSSGKTRSQEQLRLRPRPCLERAIPPRTGDSASNGRFRLEPAIPPLPAPPGPRFGRKARRQRPGLPGIGRGRRHSPARPVPGSPGRPTAPEPPGPAPTAGPPRPPARPAARSPPPARSAPGRACRLRERSRGCRSARAPRVPARCPVPNARCPVPLPSRRPQPLPPAAPPPPAPRSPFVSAPGAANGARRGRGSAGTERLRAAPSGSRRHRAAPGGTGRPEAPAAAAEPRALLAAGLAAGPVPPQSQRPARPTGVREPPLTGGVLRAAAAEPGGAGGGCGIPGSASGLAVPAGDAPLLPQPRALRARTGEKQKILLSNPGRALKIFMRPILLL